MCLEFPGRVVSRDGDAAVVDTEGRLRRASALLIPDIEVGDWVLVTAGTVVSRLDPAEAARLRADIGIARGANP